MSHSAGPELTLYLREGTHEPAQARQDAARARARALVDSGVADSLSVETWDGKVAVDGSDPEQTDALATFEAFSDWARAEDVRLYPAFQTRECYSWADAKPYTALVFPVMCLAVRTDGDIDGVYPHVNGDTYSVFDGLAIITAREHEPVSSTDSGVPAE